MENYWIPRTAKPALRQRHLTGIDDLYKSASFWGNLESLDPFRHRRAMKAAQAFGVAVRIVGLLLCLAALFYIASGVLVWLLPNYRPNLSPPWHYLISGLFLLLVGWFFLRRADHIVSIAYGGGQGSDVTDV